MKKIHKNMNFAGHSQKLATNLTKRSTQQFSNALRICVCTADQMGKKAKLEDIMK